MPFIQWDPSFSVGAVVLDNDHKKLIDILNGIYDAWQNETPSAAELRRLFDELLDYTDGHFSREEGRLAARDYPDLAAHHADHERLRELVLAFRSRHLAGRQADTLTEEMAKFLKTWLVDHILGEDLKYRSLFIGR